jgi:thiol-disulfide isomerase/thioredoxin
MISRRLVLAGAMASTLRCAHSRAGQGDYLRYASALPRLPAQGGEFDAVGLSGRVVLVTFIATWCFPCLADLTSLQKLASDYGALGFSNVLVGMDLEGLQVLRPFAEHYHLEAPLLVADEALRAGHSPFGLIKELPTRVLFGRDGSPVVGFTGVARHADLATLVATELARP